jgi:mannose-1-phosphate guanylyltransferase
LAKEHLKTAAGRPFFVFNSDVTCEYPLQDLLDFHENHGKEGTIMVTQVKDPSKYGVVLYGVDGQIQSFVEKPKEWVGDRINAGLYIFSPSILSRIPNKPTSIEREIFPVMASEGNLFAMDLPGYWMDIGQPKDYLTGTVMHLASLAANSPERLATGAHIEGSVLIHESAKVGEGCLIGPDVVIGAGAVVGDGVRLQRCTLMQDVHVMNHAFIKNSIIGWSSTVGAWSRVEGSSVIGEDVQVGDGVALNGTIVLPHKGVKDSFYEAGKIIM